MRLVSQDKATDIPYESVMVELVGRNIEGVNIAGGTRYIFGQYDTRKDAEYAMKALRDSYRRNEAYFCF